MPRVDRPQPALISADRLGACVVASALCGLLALTDVAAATTTAKTPKTPGDVPAEARAAGDRATQVSTRRLVYSCIAPGLVTFSDRPCGPRARSRELTVNTPVAPPALSPDRTGSSPTTTSRLPSARATATGEHVDAGDDVAAQAHLCERLQRSVTELDDHMRAGYSAREAGRLWSRWREARQRVREAGC